MGGILCQDRGHILGIVAVLVGVDGLQGCQQLRTVNTLAPVDVGQNTGLIQNTGENLVGLVDIGGMVDIVVGDGDGVGVVDALFCENRGGNGQNHHQAEDQRDNLFHDVCSFLLHRFLVGYTPALLFFAEAGRLKRLPPFLFCAYGCIQTSAPPRSAAVR